MWTNLGRNRVVVGLVFVLRGERAVFGVVWGIGGGNCGRKWEQGFSRPMWAAREGAQATDTPRCCQFIRTGDGDEARNEGKAKPNHSRQVVRQRGSGGGAPAF